MAKYVMCWLHLPQVWVQLKLSEQLIQRVHHGSTEEACAYYSRPMISDLVSGKADLQK